VQAKFGQQWNQDFGVGILGEQVGFEELDAFETPGGIGHFVDQFSFGGGGGFVLVEKLLDVKLVGCGVLCGQDCGAGGEAMGQGVARRTLFAGFGARAGGVEGVAAVGAVRAVGGGALFSWI